MGKIVLTKEELEHLRHYIRDGNHTFAGVPLLPVIDLAKIGLAVTNERWVPVPGWESLYLVSDAGNFKTTKGEPVGQWLSDQGYMRVYLKRPNRIVRAHRLVALAFIANEEGKPHVNHKDNNRANNVHSNLEWVTQSENLEHMTRQGRRNNGGMRGLKNPRNSINTELATTICRLRLGGMSFGKIATKVLRSKRSVQRVVERPSDWAVPLTSLMEGK
jgi:hypothetical protein